MKKRQEQGGTSSTTLGIEVWLNWLVADIKTAMDAETEEMKKKVTEGFCELKNQLEYLVYAVLKKELEAPTMQNLGSINTGTQIQNVQIPPHAIETNNEDLNVTLQQL